MSINEIWKTQRKEKFSDFSKKKITIDHDANKGIKGDGIIQKLDLKVNKRPETRDLI